RHPPDLHSFPTRRSSDLFKPDLILLDLVMPTMDGRHVAACLQASPILQGVPIIFLTARITKEEVDAVGGRMGGFPFLAKPIAPADRKSTRLNSSHDQISY